MNEEQHNQERERLDRKYKGMAATMKAFKEQGVSALDTQPPKSKSTKVANALYLIGGLLMGAWLVAVIAYGLREVFQEIITFLIYLPLLMVVAWVVYNLGKALGFWDRDKK